MIHLHSNWLIFMVNIFFSTQLIKQVMFFFIANEGSKDGTLITPHNFAVECFTTNKSICI